ncbi:hypothetical protein KDM41_05580 [bacterium]|nr:hypothetical protein [bacterium]
MAHRFMQSTGRLTTLAIVVVAVATAAGAALADSGAEAAFLRTEYQVLGAGASSRWQARDTHFQIGGEESNRNREFGSPEKPEEKEAQVEGHHSNTGEKVKAGLYSAILPGAGQYYNGQKSKAYIMGGIEVAIWTAWFVFDAQGDNKRDDAEEWAALYAGTSGEHPDSYWQDVGHFANSDSYNESVLREARALGETPSGLVSGADTWQWVNDDRQTSYQQLRADGNAAYDRRDFMILFAVVNRVVSVVDAVIGAGGKAGAIETEVMGLNLEMEMLPSWQDPGARCVVSRSF